MLFSKKNQNSDSPAPEEGTHLILGTKMAGPHPEGCQRLGLGWAVSGESSASTGS